MAVGPMEANSEGAFTGGPLPRAGRHARAARALVGRSVCSKCWSCGLWAASSNTKLASRFLLAPQFATAELRGCWISRGESAGGLADLGTVESSWLAGWLWRSADELAKVLHKSGREGNMAGAGCNVVAGASCAQSSPNLSSFEAMRRPSRAKNLFRRKEQRNCYANCRRLANPAGSGRGLRAREKNCS